MNMMQATTIDISGISPVRLLAALHQRAKYEGGLGYNTYRTPMTEERAAVVLGAASYHHLDCLDFVEGKILGLKIDCTGPEPSFGNRLDPVLYDAYNGAGTAKDVVAWLRKVENLSPWYEQISAGLQPVFPIREVSLFPAQ